MSQPWSPLYLAVEGLDGCGKTTAIDKARRHLETKGIRTVSYHDPDVRLPIGKMVKRIWSTASFDDEEPMHLLFAASSLEAQSAAFRRAQENGSRVIISDRCPLSTYAYLASLNKKRFFELHEQFKWPDTLLFLSSPDEVRKSRLAMRDKRPASFVYPDSTILMRYESIIGSLSNRGVWAGQVLETPVSDHNFAGRAIAAAVERSLGRHGGGAT